jgi:hypothetical protein
MTAYTIFVTEVTRLQTAVRLGCFWEWRIDEASLGETLVWDVLNADFDNPYNRDS